MTTTGFAPTGKVATEADQVLAFTLVGQWPWQRVDGGYVSTGATLNVPRTHPLDGDPEDCEPVLTISGRQYTGDTVYQILSLLQLGEQQ